MLALELDDCAYKKKQKNHTHRSVGRWVAGRQTGQPPDRGVVDRQPAGRA